MKHISYIILLLLLGSGCTKDETEPCGGGNGKEVVANITIVSKESNNINGRAVYDDDIRNVHFFIFDNNGALLHHQYADISIKIQVPLISGRTYRFYAVTNTSEASLFSRTNTEDILKKQIYTIPDIDYLENTELLVMSGSKEEFINTTTLQTNISIPVYRISAKINMEVRSAIPGYDITGMYLCNVPSSSFYCGQGEDIAEKGFYKEERELPVQNKKTGFYMLENRAGGRIKVDNSTGNEAEQKEKRKYAPENATYIRIEGTFTDKTGFSEITYQTKHWIYLGQDNSKDYNVGRNETHEYTVIIKGIEEGDTDTRVEITEKEVLLGDDLDPANCYIVDRPGNFKIDAKYMGNRTNQLIDIGDKNVAADYLWTSVPGAVADVRYNKEDSCIYFSLNKDPVTGEAYRGNTVVALYDEDTKEILWSWHLWLTETPGEVVTGGKCKAGSDQYPADAAKGKMIIMDRNLGAVSADPADGWKTYGCYYQMGRKDPFVGANRNGTTDRSGLIEVKPKDEISKIKEYETYPFGEATEYTEWNIMLAPSGWSYYQNFITAREGVRQPMTFARGASDNRWTNEKINKGDPIFESNGNHEDYWNRTKTINDPCPSGWTIIGKDAEFWDKNDVLSAYVDNETGVSGVYSQLPGYARIWWPSSGERSVNGTISDIGYSGVYACYDHVSNSHGAHTLFFEIKEDKGKYSISLDDDKKTNHATSIRCVKVKQNT